MKNLFFLLCVLFLFKTAVSAEMYWTGEFVPDEYGVGNGVVNVTEGGFSVFVSKENSINLDSDNMTMHVCAGFLTIHKYTGSQKWDKALQEFAITPYMAVLDSQKNDSSYALTVTGDESGILNGMDCAVKTYTFKSKYSYKSKSGRSNIIKGIFGIFKTKTGIYQYRFQDKPEIYESHLEIIKKIIETIKPI